MKKKKITSEDSVQQVKFFGINIDAKLVSSRLKINLVCRKSFRRTEQFTRTTKHFVVHVEDRCSEMNQLGSSHLIEYQSARCGLRNFEFDDCFLLGR